MDMQGKEDKASGLVGKCIGFTLRDKDGNLLLRMGEITGVHTDNTAISLDVGLHADENFYEKARHLEVKGEH